MEYGMECVRNGIYIGHQTLATRERKRVEILLDSVLWE